MAKAMKSTIQGWGADLDPKERPGVPRERTPPFGTGAHWNEPERQVPRFKILVSPEHKGLTPVFGTSAPLKGLSGKIREFAFRYSEGQKLHWLLLLLGDRVDVIESTLTGMWKGESHNPLKEMGLKAEFSAHGFFSRFGQHRSDLRRWAIQGVLLIAPPLLIGIPAVRAVYKTRAWRRFDKSAEPGKRVPGGL